MRTSSKPRSKSESGTLSLDMIFSSLARSPLKAWTEPRTPEAEVETINDWSELVENDPAAALDLQLRVRAGFESALARGLHAAAFKRDDVTPRYLFFSKYRPV